MEDIIILILNNFTISQIIKFELVCKTYKKLIRNHHWINKKITLYKKNYYILINYNFKNISVVIDSKKINKYIDHLKIIN